MNSASDNPTQKRKPEWLKIRPGGGGRYAFVKGRLKTLDLHTVCEEAHCPNVAECWGGGTATIMILGDVCTRGCRFCAVATGNPKGVVDEEEPRRVAEAIAELGLDYVVLTSVDRDDLPDGGAEHFAKTVEAVREISTKTHIEVLIPDFKGDTASLARLVDSKPDVIGHNVETIQRLTPLVRDRRAGYEKSLNVLKTAKSLAPERYTKSSILLGLGETEAELFDCMKDLRKAEVDMVTLGQYLQPTPKHCQVEKYYTPDEFKRLEAQARTLGFRYVASGPLVRSSYRAGELFIKGLLEAKI